MKLVASIYHMEEIKKIKPYAEAVLVDFTLITKENIEEILKQGLLPILKYNQMIHPFEIEQYSTYFEQYKTMNCLFYITDLGLTQMLKKRNLLHRTIFDPMTMITNHLDAESYMKYGFHAIGLSNEITLKDVNTIYLETKAPIFYQVFGYRQMLHSRRKLISLYLEKIEKEVTLENLWIEEITRNEKYPILENERGTFIYRGYILSLLKELKRLPLEYAFLESFSLDFTTYIQCLSLFHEVCKGKDIARAQEEINALGLNFQEGFSYKDSIYMKEEF